jgi:hypothetical protein
MNKNQNGFIDIGIIAITLIIIGVVGFIGFRAMTSRNKPAAQNQATDKYSFTTLEACKTHYVAELKDQGKANDTCLTLLSKSTVTPATGQEAGGGVVACMPEPPVVENQNAFTSLPVDVAQVKVITLGKETNDSRFVYPWVKTDKTNIYAPASGKLYMIRHKVFVENGKNGNDYDLFFAVDCKTVYRFNHISNPRDDIKATYPAGDLPSGDYANGGLDIPERVKPKSAIVVKAGESLGFTVGTPTAHNFDFAVGIGASKEADKLAVCPFDAFSEPNKSILKNLLGSKAAGVPQPGYACDIESKKF